MSATQRGQRAPLPTPRDETAQEAVTKLIRVVDAITRSLDRTFARFDLTGPQYNVLRILRGAGEPLPTMKLAGRMLQKTPGVTGLLDRLEEKGLVQRKRSTEDRRVWLCSITEEGLQRLDEMELPVREANRYAVRGASRKELQELMELMDRIEQPYARE